MTSTEIARRNRLVLVCSLSIVVVMAALTAASPLFYGAFVDYIGFGGSLPQTTTTKTLTAASGGAAITVRFDTNVEGGLDWTFEPETHAVQTTLGAPRKLYLDVVNRSRQAGVVETSFNVTPEWAAPYFFKGDDFSAPLERLSAGEKARMPLAFYVDPRIAADRFASTLPTITVSFTLFPRAGTGSAALARIPDLREHADALDRAMKESGKAVFVNDAPNG